MRFLHFTLIPVLHFLSIIVSLASEHPQSLSFASGIIGRASPSIDEGLKFFMDYTYFQMIKAHRSYKAALREPSEAEQALTDAQVHMKELGELRDGPLWRKARIERDAARALHTDIHEQHLSKIVHSRKNREQALKILIRIKTLNRDLHEYGSTLFNNTKAATILNTVRKDAASLKALRLAMTNEHARRAATELCCKEQVDKFRHIVHIEQNCANILATKYLPSTPRMFDRGMLKMWERTDQERLRRARLATGQGLKAVAHHRALCMAGMLNRDLQKHIEKLDVAEQRPEKLRSTDLRTYFDNLIEPEYLQQKCEWCRRTKLRLSKLSSDKSNHAPTMQGLSRQDTKESTSFPHGKIDRPQIQEVRDGNHLNDPDQRDRKSSTALNIPETSLEQHSGPFTPLYPRSDNPKPQSNDIPNPQNNNLPKAQTLPSKAAQTTQALHLFLKNEASKLLTSYLKHQTLKQPAAAALKNLHLETLSTVVKQPGAVRGPLLTNSNARHRAALTNFLSITTKNSPDIERTRALTTSAFKNLLAFKKVNKGLRQSVIELISKPRYRDCFNKVCDEGYKAYMADKALRVFVGREIGKCREACRRVGESRREDEKGVSANKKGGGGGKTGGGGGGGGGGRGTEKDVLQMYRQAEREYERCADGVCRVMMLNKGLREYARKMSAPESEPGRLGPGIIS